MLTNVNLQLCADALASNKKLLVIAGLKDKQHPIVSELKSLRVPVLDALNLIHFRSIRNWMDKPNAITFAQKPRNEAIIQAVFEKYEKMLDGRGVNLRKVNNTPHIGLARFFW